MGSHSSSRRRQGARQARLGLAALAEKDDVLAGQERVFDLRDDGFFETDDARELRFVRFELANQVLSQLFLDGPRPIPRCPQLAKSGRQASRDIGWAVLRRIRHIFVRLLGGRLSDPPRAAVNHFNG